MIKNKLILFSLILSVLLIVTLANAETYTFTLRPTETADQEINYTNTYTDTINATFSVKNLQITKPSHTGKDDAITFSFADGTHNNVGTGVKITDILTLDVSDDASAGTYTADVYVNAEGPLYTTDTKIHNLVINIEENNAPTFSGVEDFELEVGGTKEITVAIDDVDNDDLTISWSGQPTGMTLSETDDEITISWTPTETVSATTVTLKANDGFGEVTKTFTASATMSGLYLNIPDIELGSSSQQRDLVTKTFTISNSGSETVNSLGVQINSNDLGFVISQEPASSLAPGDSTVMVITLDIPSDQDSGTEDIGELIFTYDGTVEIKKVSLTTKANIDFYDDEVEYEINDGKTKSIDDGDNIDVDPGDTVLISFRVESLIDDIEFDEDDIEAVVECDEFDYEEDLISGKTLDSDGDKTDTFEFEIDIPYDADDGTQDALITIEAEDENGALHTIEFDFEFDVNRPKHDIRIIDLRFINNRVEAGNTVTLEIEIENTGEKDEEKVYIEIQNSELDIEKRIGPIEIDSDDNEKKTVIIEIPDDADDRDYVFYVTTMYDMDRETDEEYATLTVYNDEITPTPNEPDDNVIIVPNPEPQLNNPVYGKPIVNKGIFGENSLTILVVILIVVIIALLVIILIPSKKL